MKSQANINRFTRPFLYVFLTAALALVVGVVEQVFGLLRHPSNTELQRYVEENQSHLNRLVSMMHEDDVSSVLPNWNRTENSMAEGRWLEYRRLFTELGLELGVHDHGDKIVFTRSVSSSGGTSKGIAYFPEGAPNEANCCLILQALFDEESMAFKKILDGWYIYYAVTLGG